MTEPTDDQVHRFVQRMLQDRKSRYDNARHVEMLKTIITDLWALRERDRKEYEAALVEKLATTSEADALVRKMRDYGVASWR